MNATLPRGSILVEQAYAQGKMLDHSSWVLPRNITPSDIDAVVDANGSVIFAELSTQCTTWGTLRKGQRLLHEALVRGGPHCSALCFHSVGAERPINSKTDVDSFQLILFDHGLIELDVWEGRFWPGFVENWVKDPLRARRRLISRSLGNGEVRM